MLYGQGNTGKASVIDMDSGVEICRVKSLDTESGEVVVYQYPFVVGEDKEVVTHSMRFDSIHAITGGKANWPVLFHCYGRATSA